ncbi:hypothetical protein H4S06_005667, partial [Coemansia sp. BCRC 34490]
EYERKWLLRLRTDGLQDMYETNMKIQTEEPHIYRPMSGLRMYGPESEIKEDTDNNNQLMHMAKYGNENNGASGTSVLLSTSPYMEPNGMRFERRSLDSMQNEDEGTWQRRIL